CLFPPLRSAATSRLLVRIGRIGQVKLDNGVTKKTEVLLAWRVAANLPPALPRRIVLHARIAFARLTIAFQPTSTRSITVLEAPVNTLLHDVPDARGFEAKVIKAHVGGGVRRLSGDSTARSRPEVGS